ncbi:hypothetical protein ONZ45_g18279 [Pleurotus djamor]|nr:hypothetical protein ONZ45_g18279 [Pleurotus djamor]
MPPSKTKSKAKPKRNEAVMLPGGAMQTVLEFSVNPNPGTSLVRRSVRNQGKAVKSPQKRGLRTAVVAGGNVEGIIASSRSTGPGIFPSPPTDTLAQTDPFLDPNPPLRDTSTIVRPRRNHVNFNLVRHHLHHFWRADRMLFLELRPKASSLQQHQLANLRRHLAAPKQPEPPRSGPHSQARKQVRRRMGQSFKAKHRSCSDDVFTFYKEKEGKRVCILCERALSANSSLGLRVHEFSLSTASGGLRRHLYTIHLDEWVKSCDAAGIKIANVEALSHITELRYRENAATNGPRPREKYTPLGFLDVLAKCFATNDLSINLIESPEFRDLFLMLREDFKDNDIPHRTSLHTRLKELWETMGKISFSTDIWSDPNLTPFMAVTAHWIQGTIFVSHGGRSRYAIRMRADLIGFSHIPGSHTGESICKTFLAVLERVGIKQRIGWVTVDNASNNTTFIECLERELKILGIPFSQSERHIRCFPHIVNLACKAVLQGITNMKYAEDYTPGYDPTQRDAEVFVGLTCDPVANVRAFIRAARASSLLRDIDIRWSSVLLMIDRAIILRSAIEKFLNQNEFPDLLKYRLNDSEWDALAIFKDVLLVPHAFQQKLSAEKTPTLCYALPSFAAMHRKWVKQQEMYPMMSDAIQAGLDKLSDYQGRLELIPAYILAMAVNPNIKLRWYSAYLPEEITFVRRELLRALQPYYVSPTTGGTQAPEKPSQNVLGSNDWVNDVLDDDILPSTQHYDTLEDEVTAYLAEAQLSLDPLAYWQDNQARYKTIFALAMDILPIQGSSVSCERVFSSAKETTTMRRNRISPELMEWLQVLKFYLKKGRELDFTGGTSHEAELQNLEELNNLV